MYYIEWPIYLPLYSMGSPRKNGAPLMDTTAFTCGKGEIEPDTNCDLALSPNDEF